MHTFEWSGSHVNGSRACAVVKYSAPNNRGRGSRWFATIKRDSQNTWKGSATFEEGPIVAALKAISTAGVDWQPTTCHSIDSDTYCVGF